MNVMVSPRLSLWRLSCTRLINNRLHIDSRFAGHSGIIDSWKTVTVNRSLCNVPYRMSAYSTINRFMCSSSTSSGKDKDILTSGKHDGKDKDGSNEKPGLVARFKEMYKKYWYVLVPVHVITSTGWIALFYYLSVSGVDIPSLLQSISVSETLIDKLKDSKMGHLAIAYMCYKIATPLRYTVTLGGTTLSIKYLSQRGFIKPAPTLNREIRKMYEDRKEERARRRDNLDKDDAMKSKKTLVSSIVEPKENIIDKRKNKERDD